MASKNIPRPRLKNLDDLFQLNDGVNPLAQKSEKTDSVPPAKRLQINIVLDRLIPYSNHPFRLYEGERLADMVESIRQHGVLVPILVRRMGEQFEILSGHNRVNASRLAGLMSIPAIVLENVSDADVWIYVIETNLMQRSFTDMSHSEKAAVIAAHYSKLFSQGKRNDIHNKLKQLEELHDLGPNITCAQIELCTENITNAQNEHKSDEYITCAQNEHKLDEDTTCAQNEHKLKSRDIVAQEYSLDRNTIARYLRVFQLIDALKVRLDNGEVGFIASVELSFLSIMEQEQLEKCISQSGLSVDGKKASLLRAYSKKGELDEKTIYLILSGNIGVKNKPNRTPTVKVSKQVYAQYFRADQPAKEVQEIVEKALVLYFSQTM